jgi:hypothetical protein
LGPCLLREKAFLGEGQQKQNHGQGEETAERSRREAGGGKRQERKQGSA